MKPLIFAIVVCCGALSVSAAFAAPDYPAAGGTSSNKLVESVDSGGGGGSPARAMPSSVPRAAVSIDHGSVLREAASNTDSDPSAPVTVTPRRPTYRWQSLVPGAIK